jgi:hypothetical protein
MKTVAALSASPVAVAPRARSQKKAAECGVLRADIAPSLSPRQLFICWSCYGSQSASDLILLCYTVRLRRRIKWASRTYHQSVEMRFLNFFHSEEMKKKGERAKGQCEREREDGYVLFLANFQLHLSLSLPFSYVYSDCWF